MNLKLRLVDESDCRYLYEWRNHPTARAASRNTGEIIYEDHKKWFENTLKNPNRTLYIVLDKNERVGQIRFDKENESKAEVSVSVNPEKYGFGYGTEIIKQGSAKYFKDKPEMNILRAEIKKESVNSIKVFEKAGYKYVGMNGDLLEFWLRRTQLF